MGKCMATGKETAGKLQNVWLFFRFELPKAALLFNISNRTAVR